MALFHTTVLDNQIKALPTVDTASGSIATFDTDLTENLVSVKCQIVAQQASGTPSPVNSLPITTFSEMNVIHKGKNLIDDSLYYQAGANTVVIGQTSPNSDRTIFLKAGTYTIKVEASVAGSIYYDFGNGSTRIGSTSEVEKFTLLNDSWCSFSLYKSGGFSPSDYSSVQLEFGNRATDYQAFNGNTYNIPFGQTVANGVLDITTGKLTITHSFKTFDGSENWNKHGSIASWFYVDNQIDGFMNSTMDNFQICNMGEQTKYDYVTTLTNGHFAYGSANKRFVFKNTDYTETTDFKTWLSNNNMQVAYRLPSDLIIQLDSITLQALLNENNIWCDTGDTEVKFLLTVGKKIS